MGTAAGSLVGIGSVALEVIYSGWNNTLLPATNQGTYGINNNYSWTQLHP